MPKSRKSFSSSRRDTSRDSTISQLFIRTTRSSAWLVLGMMVFYPQSWLGRRRTVLGTFAISLQRIVRLCCQSRLMHLKVEALEALDASDVFRFGYSHCATVHCPPL